jgi:DNA topoisomerase-1
MAFKYERHVVKRQWLKLDPKVKKSKPEIAEPESDMDEDDIERKRVEYEEKEQEKLDKKWEKMCAKAEEDGKSKPPKLVYEKKELTLDRCEKSYTTLCARIEQAKTLRVDKVAFAYVPGCVMLG